MTPEKNAEELFESGRLLAVLDLYRATKTEDLSPLDNFRIGDALRQIGRLQESIRVLRHVAEGESGPAFDASVSLSLALKESGDFEGAARTLDRLLSTKKSVPGWLWVIRASLAARLEEVEDALQFLDYASESSDVDLDEVYLNKAMFYRYLFNEKLARECAEKIISMGSSLSRDAQEIIDSLSVRT